jgi:vacuolar-type H+-ATPase subunit I/STV1
MEIIKMKSKSKNMRRNSNPRPQPKRESEHNTEVRFEPAIDKETGAVKFISMRVICHDCGSDVVEQIFTAGDYESEEFARELGYRPNEVDSEESDDMDTMYIINMLDESFEEINELEENISDLDDYIEELENENDELEETIEELECEIEVIIEDSYDDCDDPFHPDRKCCLNCDGYTDCLAESGSE